MKFCKFPRDKTTLLERAQGRSFSDTSNLESFLKNCSITGEGHIRTAKEAGLSKKRLENIFDGLFTQEVNWSELKKSLRSIHQNKDELLLVLNRPDIPLHTNN